MAISSDFFKQWITVFNKNTLKGDQIFDYTVSLLAFNGLGSNATTSMYVKINKPPENGSCTISPQQGVAFEDKFWINCSDWVDPEHIGIR